MVTAAEDFLHSLRGLFVGSLKQMAVEVHGEFDGGVAESLGDLLRVYSFGNQQGGVSVTQIVEPHFGQAGLAEDLLEAVQNVRGVYGRADARGEDELLFLPGGIGQ